MKKILILTFILLNLLNINTSFAGGGLIFGNPVEIKINKLSDELDYEERRNFWKYSNDYRKYSALYQTEIYKEKYKIGEVDRANKKKYAQKRDEVLKKIEKINKEISKLIKESNSIKNYKVSENILKELKIDNYLETSSINDDKSYYIKKIVYGYNDPFEDKLRMYNDGENFNLPEEFNDTIYIVKTKKQENIKKGGNRFEDDMKFIESFENQNNFLYTEKDFKKLDNKKIKLSDFKKNGLTFDFTKEFDNLLDKNLILIDFYIEKNGLYIKLEGEAAAEVKNSKESKLRFLQDLYFKENGIENEYEYFENRKSCNNKLLNDKIKKILDNIEKKINNKEKFTKFLEKIEKTLKIINSKYKENGLKIALKITTNSDISKISKEFEKYMYKGEVLEVLGKYIKFKLKENYYNGTLDEIIE